MAGYFLWVLGGIWGVGPLDFHDLKETFDLKVVNPLSFFQEETHELFGHLAQDDI